MNQKSFDAKAFAKLVKELKLPSLSGREKGDRYRKTMEKKHGKSLSPQIYA